MTSNIENSHPVDRAEKASNPVLVQAAESLSDRHANASLPSREETAAKTAALENKGTLPKAELIAGNIIGGKVEASWSTGPGGHFEGVDLGLKITGNKDGTEVIEPSVGFRPKQASWDEPSKTFVPRDVITFGVEYTNNTPLQNALDRNSAAAALAGTEARRANLAAEKAQGTADEANKRALTPGPAGKDGTPGAAGARGEAGAEGAPGKPAPTGDANELRDAAQRLHDGSPGVDHELYDYANTVEGKPETFRRPGDTVP
ncbi:hypothetical protein BH10CYA1_BH10CYA1_48650 [soil metagenome]